MEDRWLRDFIEGVDWGLAGGLHAPVGTGAESDGDVPIQHLAEVIGWEEIEGERLSMGEIVQDVEELPLDFWLQIIASITLTFEREGVRKVHSDLVEMLVPEPWRTQFYDRAEAAGHQIALFAPRQIGALTKVVLARAPLDAEKPEDPAEWKRVFFRVYSGLVDQVEEAREYGDDPFENVLQFMVRDRHFIGPPSPPKSIHRLYSILNWIPAESDEIEFDFNELFREETGLDLQQFMCMALAILANSHSVDFTDVESVHNSLVVNSEKFFENTELDSDSLRAFFDRLTIQGSQFEDLRNADLGDPQFLFDLRKPRDSPLWREGDTYVPYLAPAFRWKITDGIYYDLLSAANEQSWDNGRFFKAFGDCFEAYIIELFGRAFAESSGLADRMWANLQETGDGPEIDLLLDYGGSLIIFEIKSARYHYQNSILNGDIEYIKNEDLEKLLFGPASQLSSAIDALIEGRLTIGGRRYEGEAIYPVLITYDSLPTFGPVWNILLDELQERGILTQEPVRSLTPVDAGEATLLANLAHEGKSLRDLLRTRLSGHRHQPVLNVAKSQFPDIVGANQVLQGDIPRIAEECGYALEFEEAVPAD